MEEKRMLELADRLVESVVIPNPAEAMASALTGGVR